MAWTKKEPNIFKNEITNGGQPVELSDDHWQIWMPATRRIAYQVSQIATV